MSLVSNPRIPPELQGRILQLAAHVSSWDEKIQLMLVSRIAYDRSVSYVAYKVIKITSVEGLHQFLSSAERNNISFFASRLHGLCIRVPESRSRILWSTFFIYIIPELSNLESLEMFGIMRDGPESAVVQHALLLAVQKLPNLTYFGVDTSIFPDNFNSDIPISYSVTHLKWFEPMGLLQSTLRFLKAFPNLTHFMTSMWSASSLSKIAPITEPLSHLTVVILAGARPLDSQLLSSLFKRFPNVVFRNFYELFKLSYVPRFAETTEAGDVSSWILCEEEVLQRQQYFGIS
ncbi:hypothetical protein DL96DRAFT_352674 [Flagelloscypha sp. PMI_526]|nr:hypothetical protein DL96DRAFT_352674 [Flagelloscypha sp. PMI_526]